MILPDDSSLMRTVTAHYVGGEFCAGVLCFCFASGRRIVVTIAMVGTDARVGGSSVFLSAINELLFSCFALRRSARRPQQQESPLPVPVNGCSVRVVRRPAHDLIVRC